LVKPDIHYKERYVEMVKSWKSTGQDLEPWVLQADYSDFSAMVRSFADQSAGIGLREGFVPNSTFWVYRRDAGRIVGAVNIRHRLNDVLLRAWGNIGYGIRPDERGKGYATAALGLALRECARLGMDRVLLGCYKDNAASAAVIRKNGGVLENEIGDGGRIIQRYWITLKS
jgi:predicted acetyltransferase